MRSHWMGRWALLGLLLVLGGCAHTDTPATSSTPATPGSTTAANSGSSAPAEGGIPGYPVTNSPSVAPAPAPPPPIAIAPGTVLTVTIDQSISTKTNTAGDRFDASLAEPVTIDGTEVLPAGTRASGMVTQADAAGHLKGGAVLAISLDSITLHKRTYSIETSAFEQAGKGRGKRTAIGAGGGAAFGAIVGALAGGGKGAAIGALAGGGAGTAGTAFTGKRDFTIPAETRVRFKLVKTLRIRR
jgi:hypothetical protein